MRYTRFLTAALLVALALTLPACKSGSTQGGLTPDESDVPAGMPVMYEFFTET